MSTAAHFLAAMTAISWIGYLVSAAPRLCRATRDFRLRRILLNLWRTTGAHGWPALRVWGPWALPAARRAFFAVRLFPWAAALVLALVLLGLVA